MRIACISDIHGNLYALEKALKCIDGLNIDEIIFLGDAVGYIPGTQVLERLKDLNITCLMGNHEEMLLNNIYTGEKDKVYRHSETHKKLERFDFEYIKSWPTEFYKGDVSFFHASPNDHLHGYIYPDTDLGICIALPENIRYCVFGHTHRPFIRTHKNVTFINTGSVGLPRDDGRYGAFAVIDTDNDTAEIIRLNIVEETKQSIDEFGPVHSSVSELVHRRAKEPLVGDVMNV